LMLKIEIEPEEDGCRIAEVAILPGRAGLPRHESGSASQGNGPRRACHCRPRRAREPVPVELSDRFAAAWLTGRPRKRAGYCGRLSDPAEPSGGGAGPIAPCRGPNDPMLSLTFHDDEEIGPRMLARVAKRQSAFGLTICNEVRSFGARCLFRRQSQRETKAALRRRSFPPAQ